ncbi:ultraviolet-B receptor UVR8-like [Lolium rigidum]|uniref:ultraviolet-B receptor UVR8-like n=1 Tax=Lolium rigidum TaxID=89674 RepID=UPI001F5D862E|nr:ultraviolet-B receptor UVR8-like [Lolium rigidum]
MECPMDATASEASLVIQFHNIVHDATSQSPQRDPEDEHTKRHFSGEEAIGQFPLAANPSILLQLLSSCELDPKDLAALEATCTFFRNPAKFPPDLELSLPELAAFDMCQDRAMFKLMGEEEKEWLKQRCGGSWKLVLGYILVGEKNYRRGKSQVSSGPGYSIVVTSKGDVYSFGANSWGQLGLGDMEHKFKPCLIRSLQGIRITQVAVGSRRTMLVSDTGSVYKFGHSTFGPFDYYGAAATNEVSCPNPQLVESLKGIFVVQASIGGFFSAVLSREGRVYTFSWGQAERVGHATEIADVEPRLLSGPLEDVLVVQIAAGNCYLLMLAYHPNGMSVYSVGCGLGGKLGHGNTRNEGTPLQIEHFQTFNIRPMSISAGAFHAAVLSSDGRIFTWGWGVHGCLGRGAEEYMTLPTAVETLKAVHVSAGYYTTFVITDNGEVYTFGQKGVGLQDGEDDESGDILAPKLVTSLAGLEESFVQFSTTNAGDWIDDKLVYAHTVALTNSGKMYAFGGGSQGQLGVKLAEGKEAMPPFQVAVNLI